jgi:hypothetical protein
MGLFSDLTDDAMRNVMRDELVPFTSIPKILRAAMLNELPRPKTAAEQKRVIAEVERMYRRLQRKGDLASRVQAMEASPNGGQEV